MQHSNLSSSNNSKPFISEGLNLHVLQGQHDLLALHQKNPQRYPFYLKVLPTQSTLILAILRIK